MGIVIAPVPVTGLAANFSPMPRMAPPPLGSEIEGASARLAAVPAFSLRGALGSDPHEGGCCKSLVNDSHYQDARSEVKPIFDRSKFGN